jgi:hypothetical protein
MEKGECAMPKPAEIYKALALRLFEQGDLPAITPKPSIIAWIYRGTAAETATPSQLRTAVRRLQKEGHARWDGVMYWLVDEDALAEVLGFVWDGTAGPLGIGEWVKEEAE